ncbi:hypothetical protein DYBT9275_01641 [Dyadobacter sp. CECT 9275]|uniref:LVIVD repeat-containing protein n=1 Tax=Dyadobacter helix TaxID=2822344 RepID=A0A916JAM5_9BACT|nr:hypothetical protein [Dyadobacter sp. CECT 9275]CAG4995451.1 hypothetical protein DYBT9275_01641 [Dyadobacter sp. CECT 9275]
MKIFIRLFLISLTVTGNLCILTSCDTQKADSASVNPQNGVGGSMARFAITGNTLYIVSKQALEVYDITSGGEPVKKVKKEMGVGIETIFPYQNHLYIGASDGMYIYSNSSPQNPQFLSKYTHIQSCDPVVVQDQFAYVTLRSGVMCRPWAGQSSLDVVDVSNPANPRMISSQPMQTPYGLGVSGNKLFVCEGDNGLKVMDISQPGQPVLKKHFTTVPSYDVIVRANHLMITGRDGFLQYTFDDQDRVEFLSKIPVE